LISLHESVRQGTPSLEAPGSDSPGSRGWTLHSESCAPKQAALASLDRLEPPAALASVRYVSHGNVLVVAAAESARAAACARELAQALPVTVLASTPVDAGEATPWSGTLRSLEGYLGEFTAELEGLAGAGKASRAKFDLVLDFSVAPVFAMREPPQGYFRAPRLADGTLDEVALAPVLAEIREAVGEFEKPRYFAYRENLCAHERSSIEGCRACIEVCSTGAIAADGDHVKVDPHLCMGCGACSTVCPSGAMGYQFPRVADRGAQMKQLLTVYRAAGGEAPMLLFHDGAGRERFDERAAEGRGLPARTIPVEAWHVAATGLDLLLPAIAFGANQVVVLLGGHESPEYVAALRAQMDIGGTILEALGYGRGHFRLLAAGDLETLATLPPAKAVAQPATFLLGNDKRTAIEFAVEHLVRHAPTPVAEIALPAGAPFGAVQVDAGKCTLCMSCAGACPSSALMDGADRPALRFLERNCVQCGLCENTCPEDAITLVPRLLLGAPAREARVLHETTPFHCLSCGKAFGTQQMVTTMLGRLAGHSMFQDGAALKRLQMCADCRVVDLMASKDEASVLRL
jgi:ferredoxin